MKTLLMKGKPVADAYREIISAKIAAARAKGVKVTLAIIVVGDDPASHVYKDRQPVYSIRSRMCTTVLSCHAYGFSDRLFGLLMPCDSL